jgi:hypothetical protein
MPLAPVKALEEVSGSWGSDFCQNCNFSELEICQTWSRFVKLGTDLSQIFPESYHLLYGPD